MVQTFLVKATFLMVSMYYALRSILTGYRQIKVAEYQKGLF